MFGLSKRVLIVIGVLIVVVIVYVLQGGKNGSAQQGSDNGVGGQCQVQVTADALNVRVNPNGGAQVVGKLSNGAVMAAQKVVQNGYRELGNNRWVASQFVKPVSGSC